MNILFHDNYVDMIGPLAAQHGMTREEYIAYFHSVMVVSEMIDQNKKDIELFEKYQKYSDYKGKTPDLKWDIQIAAKHLMPTFDEKWIKSIEEQSQEDKGIKFEIVTSTGDVLHAFKVGSYIGQWEWYLNKKKKDAREIKEYLTLKALTPYEIWQMSFDSFDHYAAFSDDNRAWNAASNHERVLRGIYDKLSASDQKKAYKYYTQSKYIKNPVNFLDFKGI